MKLTQIELAVAIQACKDAGAVNAAKALSLHIALVECEVEQLQIKLKNAEHEIWEFNSKEK